MDFVLIALSFFNWKFILIIIYFYCEHILIYMLHVHLHFAHYQRQNINFY